MPRDSSGNTSPLPGTLVNSGDTILPSQHNPMVSDVYAMMTQSLSRDGQGGMRAPLNMNGFQIQNVGQSTLDSSVATVGMMKSSSPIGTMVDYIGDSAPSGWMLCFGQAISRTAYAELFAIAGTKFGAGDGSTTFNIPDLRGRVSVGKDDMGGTDSARMSFWGSLAKTIGGVFGTASVVLTVEQLAKHSHTGTTDTSGAHTHNLNGVAWVTGGQFALDRLTKGSGSIQTSSAGAHTHPFTTAISGNDAAHSNTQPSIVMNKIIKVSNNG